MSTAALIIAIFAGVLGCGLLLAGILMLRDFHDNDAENEDPPGRILGEFLDGLLLFGAVSTARDTAKNWSSRRDARRFICAGFTGLLLMAAALYCR